MSKTENLTILFTDMVGFTELTSRQSREQNKTMLREHDRLLFPVLAAFGGHRVKSIGDALLVSFRSPTDAIHCGMALHDTLAEYNAGRAEIEQINIRVSINVGEVRVESRDVFGEAVNVAARVQSITPSGEIYFTEAVYLAMNKAEVSSELTGEHKLKGIPETVRVYRVPPRQVNRLVPGGEDLGTGLGELPYNGMHRRLPKRTGLGQFSARMPQLPWRTPHRPASAKQAPTANIRRRRIGSLAALGLVLVTAGWFLAKPGHRHAPTAATTASHSPAAGQATATAAPAEALPASRARQIMSAAHDAFARDARRDAVPLYAEALALDPSLNADPKLAANLVACLSWASDLATPVIRKHAGPAIHTALAERVLKPGLQARERAITLLKEFGQEQRIDYRALLTEELASQVGCTARLSAIERILSAQPALAAQPAVAREVMTCLDANHAQAESLLRQYRTEPMLDALSRRAVEPSMPRRARAIALLTALGQARRIDHGAASVLDFKEAQDCGARVEAAKRLREQRERRALPVLKAALGDGVGDWVSSLCWRGAVTKAIAAIESSP